MKIVGVEHKTGTYNGNDYDNYIIHVVDEEPFSSSLIAGGVADSYKVKARCVGDVFCGAIKTESDFKNIIGCSADIRCNKYGETLQIKISDKGVK